MSRGGMYAKMAGVYDLPIPNHSPYNPPVFPISSPPSQTTPADPRRFTLCAVGGPILMYYVTPSEGELFKRFNPELQKYNLENRERRQRDYEDFVSKLKEYSKSDKPIWQAAAEAQESARLELVRRQKEGEDEAVRMREEMRREMGKGS